MLRWRSFSRRGGILSGSEARGPAPARLPRPGTGLASSSTLAEPTRPRGRPARRLGLRLPAGEYRPALRRAHDRVPARNTEGAYDLGALLLRFKPTLALSVPEAHSHPSSRMWHPLHVRGNRLITSASALSSTVPLLCMILIFPSQVRPTEGFGGWIGLLVQSLGLVRSLGHQVPRACRPVVCRGALGRRRGAGRGGASSSSPPSLLRYRLCRSITLSARARARCGATSRRAGRWRPRPRPRP